MIRKRLTAAVALSAAAGLLLSGCGRSDTTAAPPSSTTAVSGKATGTLNVWAQGTEGEALPKLLKDFEAENPDLKINVTAVPWDSALSKYQTALAGGTGPDVGMFGTDWMPGFRTMLQTVPSGIDTAGFFPSAVDAGTVGGAKLAVPWFVDTRVVYYRTDLAKKAGYDSVPTDWAGFQEFAKALQDKAGAKYGIGLATSGTNSFLNNLPLIWSAGGGVINSDNSKWTFDSPPVVKAMSYYNSFFERGIANKTPSTAAGAAESAFVNGSVPMMISGPWEIGSLNQAGGAGFENKYAVAKIPADTSSTSFLGGCLLGVPKTAKNSDAAWKLVQYLAKPSTQVAWFKLVGDLPAQQSSWTDSTLASDSKVAVFGEQLKSVKVPPAIAAWNQVSAQADSAQEQVVAGGVAPAAAMKSLQQKAESIGTAK